MSSADVGQPVDQRVDHVRLDLRLVALDVDDDRRPLNPPATSATRSVPLWWAGEVITTVVPNGRRAAAIRSSSVATITSRTRRHPRTRSTTCCTSGRPVSAARILAGNRVDPYRAGMTTTALKAGAQPTPAFGPGQRFVSVTSENRMPAVVGRSARPRAGRRGCVARPERGISPIAVDRTSGPFRSSGRRPPQPHRPPNAHSRPAKLARRPRIRPAPRPGSSPGGTASRSGSAPADRLLTNGRP